MTAPDQELNDAVSVLLKQFDEYTGTGEWALQRVEITAGSLLRGTLISRTSKDLVEATVSKKFVYEPEEKN